MATVNVQQLTHTDELHHQFPNQAEPQPARLGLDTESGALYCEYNPHLDGGHTEREHYNIVLLTGIPVLTAKAANALMERVTPLAQRVLDGASVEWNGNNFVGRLNTDADAAWEEIVKECDGFNPDDEFVLVCAIAAHEWFTSDADLISQWKITAATTDEQLREIAGNEVEAAESINSRGNVVADVDEFYDYLAELRDNLDDQQD